MMAVCIPETVDGRVLSRTRVGSQEHYSAVDERKFLPLEAARKAGLHLDWKAYTPPVPRKMGACAGCRCRRRRRRAALLVCLVRGVARARSYM